MILSIQVGLLSSVATPLFMLLALRTFVGRDERSSVELANLACTSAC